MKMVGHQHEFMQKKFLLGTIPLLGIEEEFSHWPSAEDGAALPGDSGYEKCADVLGSEWHDRSGAKPQLIYGRVSPR
jgi:hypothetical protein